MRKYAVPNYICFVAYSVFVLIAMCSDWQWMADGGVVVRLLLFWLVYGIVSTAWLQIVHPPRVTARGLFYLFLASRFWR
jgi:hypothetical protein